jgi:ketosteroid isomerase-like protein
MGAEPEPALLSREPPAGRSASGYCAQMPDETTTPDLAELVRRSTEPVNSRDYDTMMRFWPPDGAWDLSPLGLGVYEGRAAVRGFLEDWIGTYESLQIEIEEICDLGNGVALAVFVQTARLPGSASSVQLRYASVAIWRDGLIERSTQYSDLDEARAAAQELAEERRQSSDL